MSASKQYLIVVSLLMLIFLAVLTSYTTLNPMRVLSYSYPMWQHTKDLSVEDLKGAHSLVVIGDSRAKSAIEPNLVDEESISLTLPGASPVDTYYTFKHYLEHHQTPEHLIIGISPHHFNLTELFWARTVGFQYLQEEEYDEVFQVMTETHDENFGDEWDRQFNRYAREYHSPHLYMKAVLASLTGERLSTNEKILAKVKASKGYYAFVTDGKPDGVSYEAREGARFKPTEMQDYYFTKLLALIEKHNINARFMLFPLNETSYETVTPEYRAAFFGYLLEKAEKFQTIAFDTDWPVHPVENFGDPNHLNGSGSRIVSREVRELYFEQKVAMLAK